MQRQVQLKYDRNHFIRVPKMLVIDDLEGASLGVLTKEEALKIAGDRGLDLVLLSPNANPPVAKIVDWSKFKYDQTKKKKQSASGTSKTKEWWFKPNIQAGDIEVKINNIVKFLKKGGTAKMTIKYQRRVTRDIMIEAMNRVLALSAEKLEPISEVKNEGQNLCVYVKLKSHNGKE